jgi:hypothetical protein
MVDLFALTFRSRYFRGPRSYTSEVSAITTQILKGPKVPGNSFPHRRLDGPEDGKVGVVNGEFAGPGGVGSLFRQDDGKSRGNKGLAT